MPRTHGMNESGLDSADVVIRTYLEELTDALIGSAVVRAAVVSEIGDGLLEAADTYVARGMKPGDAAYAAIAEFGEPRAVAAAFQS